MSPIISIIIPVYNRAEKVKVTLDSVLLQNYIHWECLVIDDGSTDKTKEVVLNFEAIDSRITYHKRPKEHLPGGNGARNYGLKLAKGKYIQWFDSDDVMYPNFLEEQYKSLVGSNAVFSLCAFDLWDPEKLLRKGQDQVIQDNFYFDYITKKIRANFQAILFTKSTLHNHGLNEKLLKSQDYEFLQRFFRAYKDQGIILNKSLFKIIRHDDSITENHTPKKIASALDALMITWAELPPDSPEQVKNKLIVLYLKTLYIAFKHRMPRVFYKYLFKTFNFKFIKGLTIVPYLSVLYFLVKILPIGNWHYKSVYKIYL